MNSPLVLSRPHFSSALAPSFSNSLVMLTSIATFIVSGATALAAATDDWNSYLHGPKHSSFNPVATTFAPFRTEADGTRVYPCASIVADWSWKLPVAPLGQPEAAFAASPTVSNGVVYIGANTGVFYAIDEASKATLWAKNLGSTLDTRCVEPDRGISSTATIAADPSRGGQLTIYVGGGDGFLYARRASDGTRVWRKFVADINAGGYNWASPIVLNGHVYMGISSNCDKPLIRGGVRQYDQATGDPQNTYWAVPEGSVGGSVWTSPASDGKSLWVTIGNPDESETGQVGDCFAIARLDAETLTRQERWIVPNLTGTDLDWGSSPTLFEANLDGNPTPTVMVGATNKNGFFYAFRAYDLASGPEWTSQQLGAKGDDNSFATKGILLAAAIWDFTDKRLFVASNETTIGGITVPGSMRRLDPATGDFIWETPLWGGFVLGTPTLSAGGVIAATTYNLLRPTANKVYLLEASKGSVINTIQKGAAMFPQPVFADTHLFVATKTGVLTKYSISP